MSDNQKIDGSNLSDNELIRQSLGFGYKINKMNRIPIFDILKREFNIEEDTRAFIVSKIIHHKIAKYADHDENDLIMGMDGIKAIQTDNPIEYMEKIEAEKNKSFIDKSINIHGDMIGSQAGHESDFGKLESKNSLNDIAAQETKQNTENNKKSENETIGQKIYRWTDHKLISILIGGILGFIATKILYWLGWLIC